ncbi:MAG: cell division protein ZapA [Geobacter sp.]
MKQTHLVTILGREIPVKSSAPEAAVREVETFVNQRIHEITTKLAAADPQLVVTLALLNLAEQYLSQQQAGTTDLGTLDGRLQEMLGRIDAAL